MKTANYLLTALLAGMLASGAQAQDNSNPVIQVQPDGVPDLARQAARDYRDRARFPHWSEAVPPGHDDPVKVKRAPTVQRLPQGDDWQLATWTSGVAYQAGQAVTLFARIETVADSDEDYPVLAFERRNRLTWSLTATVADREDGELATVRYRDDGVSPDERSGDGVYTASFVLPADAAPERGTAKELGVFITAENDEGEQLKTVGGVLFSHPAAALTGRFEDAVEDGNLVIRAEVDVQAAGRFHLSGTVQSPRGIPLATGRNAFELQPGTQWVDLTFYGLALNERGAAGPYVLGSVSLATVNGMPNALGPVIENGHRTRPYSLAQFHDRSFGREDLVEAAKRLERSAANRADGAP
ncbi:MAG: choice-of-anchor X domain-containing protein [Wenzhouxiangellaceae bacterium]